MRYFLSMLASTLVGMTVIFSAHAGESRSIGLMTGPESGTYIQIGKDIAQVMAKEGIKVEVRSSLGSIDNLKKISTTGENAALGIVQSDVLGFLKRSNNPQSQEIANKLRMIAPFYQEEVHVLASKNITSIKDLAGKRVVVGAEGSGSMLTAVNLFSLLNITPAKMYKIDPPEGVVAVLTGQADALIFVGGKPVRLFKNMEQLSGLQGENAGRLNTVHLLALDDPALLREYRPAQISPKDYHFVEKTIPTIALNAVLVGFDFTLKDTPYYHARCEQMGKLATALQKYLPDLQRTGHAKWKEVDLSAPLNLWKRDACASPKLTRKTEAAPAVAKPSPSDLLEKKSNADPATKKLQQDLLKVIQKPE